MAELKDKVSALPDTPGVYRYFDSEGTIIYVGKAKNLKRRVSQYFRPVEQLDRKTAALVANIADLQYTVVETEEDALLLENNLIKQLQPKYNILLKDDKTYPWICVKAERFPRVYLTHRYIKDGSKYYGPYASVQFARKLLDLIGSVFKVRVCRHNLSDETISAGKIRPCLNFHLGKCDAPCAGKQSQSEYDAQIESINSLLSGRTAALVESCREQMLSCAADLRFEEAAQWKERLRLLEIHHKRQKVVGHGILDMETYELLKENKLPRRVVRSQKALEELRKDLGMSAKPIHIECFDNSNIQGTNPVAACVVFKDGIPSKKDYRHFNIKTVVGANDYASMKEVVNRRYSRMLAEGESLPQLVVIDGGKGQVGCALEALAELGLQDEMFVVGLAERLEEVIIPGDPDPLFLDKNSASLRILMQIRDEAHRFGITHHRAKRRKTEVDSALRSIAGVGPATETKLLRRFHSVKRIAAAPVEDLAQEVGPKLAAIIKAELNK